MTKFTIALREIGTYREVLRSQVEHMLNDRLHQFVAVDLQDVKVRAESVFSIVQLTTSAVEGGVDYLGEKGGCERSG